MDLGYYTGKKKPQNTVNHPHTLLQVLESAVSEKQKDSGKKCLTNAFIVFFHWCIYIFTHNLVVSQRQKNPVASGSITIHLSPVLHGWEEDYLCALYQDLTIAAYRQDLFCCCTWWNACKCFVDFIWDKVFWQMNICKSNNYFYFTLWRMLSSALLFVFGFLVHKND